MQVVWTPGAPNHWCQRIPTTFWLPLVRWVFISALILDGFDLALSCFGKRQHIAIESLIVHLFISIVAAWSWSLFDSSHTQYGITFSNHLSTRHGTTSFIVPLHSLLSLHYSWMSSARINVHALSGGIRICAERQALRYAACGLTLVSVLLRYYTYMSSRIY